MVVEPRYRKKFGRTGKGKEIFIVNIPNTSLFKVEFYPGGEIPDILKGSWNDIPTLASKIQTYINNAFAKANRFNQKALLANQVKQQALSTKAGKTLVAEVTLKEDDA